MAQVFISYSRQDEKTAQRVAHALEQAGFDIWWDSHLPAHRAYSKEIQENLEAADAVVVLWSKTAAQSEWVIAEADLARNAKKIVQASLDGTIPPLPFNQIQCASLKGWRGSQHADGWQKIVSSVSSLVGGEIQPKRATAAPRPWWREPRWAAALAIGFITIGALLFLAVQKGWLGEQGPPVVAVLPFESADPANAALAAGMWEDTRQAISRNPQLLVLGPNSAKELAQSEAKVVKKSADYVVEASVRRDGPRLKISANLVRTDDGTQVWSQSFDEQLDDVFALQQRIAGEIEGRIRGRLAREGGTLPEHITTDGETYALYSEARQIMRNRDIANYERSLEILQEVVRRDPNFAPAWATLSVARNFHFGPLRQDLPGTAEGNARRAINLAPNLAAAHAALGFALGDRPEAEPPLRRAIAMDPHDLDSLNWLANLLSSRGDFAEALVYREKIIEIEPLWWPGAQNLFALYDELDRDADYERLVEKYRDLGASSLTALSQASILSKRGDLSEAAKVLLASYRDARPEHRAVMGTELHFIFLLLHMFEHADRLAAPPPFAPFLRANDPRGMAFFLEKMPAVAFFTTGPLPIAASPFILSHGGGPRLVARYHEVADNPAGLRRSMGNDDIFAALAPLLAIALQEAGLGDEANAMLAEGMDALKLKRADLTLENVKKARLLAVKGDKREAVDLLAKAVSDGWLPPFPFYQLDLAKDPAFANLQGDPRFEELRKRILTTVEREKRELGSVNLASLQRIR